MKASRVTRMQTGAAPSRGHDASSAPAYAPGVIMGCLLLALFAPRGTGIALFVSAATLSLWVVAADWKSLASQYLSATFIGLLAFGGYIAINAAWSVEKAAAYGKVFFYLATLAAAYAGTIGIKRLDRELLEQIGKGAFGSVIKCIDHKTGELVAIKMVKN